MKTTMSLGEIRNEKPCAAGWKKLIAACGTSADDHVVDLRDILRSNGPEDAWWATRCLPRRERVSLALLAARAVEHLSPAAKKCNDVTELWIFEDATDEELAVAEAAAAAAWAAEAEGADAASAAAASAWAAWAAEAAAAAAAAAWAAAAEAAVEADAAAAWASAWASASAASSDAAVWNRLGDIMQKWCDEQDEVRR